MCVKQILLQGQNTHTQCIYKYIYAFKGKNSVEIELYSKSRINPYEREHRCKFGGGAGTTTF